MPRFLPHLAILAYASYAALACRSDLDCSLNGVCSASSSLCTCRPGWIGSDCGQLDFLPAPVTEAFYRPTVATWGGSIIFAPEDGLWHMFLALIEGHCGLNAWQPNSAIYHAVSATGSPVGPYVNETLLTPWFAHNPTVTHAPDGSYIVWHIGCGGGGGGFNANCSNGTTPPAPPPPPPPPVQFKSGGQCLVSNGSFPCWTGGTGRVCAAVMGDCSEASSQWSVEGNSIISAPFPAADLNIDCNSCKEGAVAKLFQGAASGVQFNASSGQMQVVACPGMCLSTGANGGATPPCGGGGEPWSVNQVHVAPCSDPTTTGWSQVAGSTSRGRESSVGSGGCTDVNAMVSTSGINGPYVQLGILQGNRVAPIYELDNPAPWHFPNGTTWVMGRSWHPPGDTTTPIGIARSTGTTWNGSYEVLNETYPQFASVNATTSTYVPLEDPFLWVDATTGTFHALFHNMGGCSTVGCHAFSQDGWTWYLAATGPYTNILTYADGSSKNVGRRERPHLVFNSAGDPAFLSNGVQDSWSMDHSYTHVQPINVPWP